LTFGVDPGDEDIGERIGIERSATRDHGDRLAVVGVEVVRRYSRWTYRLKGMRQARTSVERASPRGPDSATLPRVHAISSRLSREVLDAIVADYEAGDSSLVVGDRYGVAFSTTLKLLHDRGVDIRIGKVRDADVPRMVELYESGLTLRAVGEGFGVSRTTVANLLRAEGVVLRKRTPS
jgi:hypothetical protein